MDKLIISCCCSNPGLPDKRVKMPRTLREMADAARDGYNSGAAIVHVHPPETEKYKGLLALSKEGIEAWMEVTHLIRQECDALIEYGTAGLPFISCEHHIPAIPKELQNKTETLSIEKPDLIVVLSGAQHNTSIAPSTEPDRGIYAMPTRDDLKRWANLCRQFGMKPTFNAAIMPNYFNIQWLAENKFIDPPYWCLVGLGGNGRGWCPVTPEELTYKIKLLPKDSMCYVCVECLPKGAANTQQQILLLTWAITMGVHVRVGMEDNPYYYDNVPAEGNGQIVDRIVRIARDIGREIATPDEARQMLGMPLRKGIKT